MSSIFSIESNLKLKLKDYFLVHVAFAEESQSTYWLLPSSMEYLSQQRQKKNLKQFSKLKMIHFYGLGD